jgi:hypothetical protein
MLDVQDQVLYKWISHAVSNKSSRWTCNFQKYPLFAVSGAMDRERTTQAYDLNDTYRSELFLSSSLDPDTQSLKPSRMRGMSHLGFPYQQSWCAFSRLCPFI